MNTLAQPTQCESKERKQRSRERGKDKKEHREYKPRSTKGTKREKKEPIIYACDFETVAPFVENVDATQYGTKSEFAKAKRIQRDNLREIGTRVWIGGVININDSTYQYIPFVDTEKESLDNFMEFVFKSPTRSIFYFHNLKFDGQFILSWLLEHNFKNVKMDDTLLNNSFY